ncbi:MAG TPA: amino acid ABC transporter permease [Alphaproteobacteria bacterium]|nr:amino acid ABC transporter permease [Alphaproteobacteria bacterium]
MRRLASWNDPRIRAWFFQIMAAVLVAGLLAVVVSNTVDNLRQLNVASGFGFLQHTAGFGISQTLIEYSESSTYGRAFWVALLNTMLVAAIGIVFATILGFLIGVARLSSNWLIARLSSIYIEFFRNIPLLLQILFWYTAVLSNLPGPRESLQFGELVLNKRGLYFPAPVTEPGFGYVMIALLLAIVASIHVWRMSQRRRAQTGVGLPVFWSALGLCAGLPGLAFLLMGAPLHFEMPELRGFNFAGGLRASPELLALVFALSIYTAAFIAEIVRSGIQAVNWGQSEAALALGLRRTGVLRLVVIPQAMRVIIPPLTSQFLNLTKNSSLAAALAYPELASVFAGTVLNQTGQAVEVLAITMAVYLSLSLLTSLAMNIFNSRMALVER